MTSYEVEDGAVGLPLPPRERPSPSVPVDRPELVFHVPPVTWVVR
ncbi:hypothetical protein [Archangium sp.]|nr:hypothetical protein [Archangium sp.]HYO54862.1 hypothetical protein [Archangium sp.]